MGQQAPSNDRLDLERPRPLGAGMIADPWKGMDPAKRPNLEPHPDIPGEYLYYYRNKVGILIPVPAAFPIEHDS